MTHIPTRNQYSSLFVADLSQGGDFYDYSKDISQNHCGRQRSADTHAGTNAQRLLSQSGEFFRCPSLCGASSRGGFHHAHQRGCQNQCRNYAGQNEPYWHLVNEPFDYPTRVDQPRVSDKPESFVLLQNYPNSFNPSTAIEFILPHRGFARLEIYNVRGEIVEVLVNRYCESGTHVAVWKADHHPSGTYFYRLRFGAFSDSKKLTLVR